MKTCNATRYPHYLSLDLQYMFGLVIDKMWLPGGNGEPCLKGTVFASREESGSKRRTSTHDYFCCGFVALWTPSRTVSNGIVSNFFASCYCWIRTSSMARLACVSLGGWAVVSLPDAERYQVDNPGAGHMERSEIAAYIG